MSRVRTDAWSRTHMWVVAEKVHEAVVRQLLKRGAADDAGDRNYGLTLPLAATRDEHEDTEKLIQEHKVQLS